jgi:predicted transcriptional regulator
MSKRMLTFSQRQLVHERISQLVTQKDNGHCSYKLGYTDASIADELGVTESQVRLHRQVHFGTMKPRRIERAGSVDASDIDVLYQLIEKLQDGALASTDHFRILQTRLEEAEATIKRHEASLEVMSRKIAAQHHYQPPSAHWAPNTATVKS